MITINANVTINRPMDEIFEFLTDLEQLPQWAVGVVESKMTSSKPRGLGTTYQIVGQVMGRRVPGTYEVKQFERPSKFGGRNSGLLSFDETYTLRSVEGGTYITQVAEVNPQGLFKLLAPLMKQALQKQLSTDFANLKRLLEQRQREI